MNLFYQELIFTDNLFLPRTYFLPRTHYDRELIFTKNLFFYQELIFTDNLFLPRTYYDRELIFYQELFFYQELIFIKNLMKNIQCLFLPKRGKTYYLTKIDKIIHIREQRISYLIEKQLVNHASQNH